MIWWTRKLRTKLQYLRIKNDVMKVYVDDVNGLFQAIKPGTTYDEEEDVLKFSIEKEEKDKDLPKDRVTMEVVNSIANSIDKMITMTFDVPSNHDDMKVSMLDVKVWVNKD